MVPVLCCGQLGWYTAYERLLVGRETFIVVFDLNLSYESYNWIGGKSLVDMCRHPES